jgi:hypothetical protein
MNKLISALLVDPAVVLDGVGPPQPVYPSSVTKLGMFSTSDPGSVSQTTIDEIKKILPRQSKRM